MGRLPATEIELRGEQGDIVMVGNGSNRGAWILAGRVKLPGHDRKSRFTSLKTLLQWSYRTIAAAKHVGA
jgi:hypothetical protein